MRYSTSVFRWLFQVVLFFTLPFLSFSQSSKTPHTSTLPASGNRTDTVTVTAFTCAGTPFVLPDGQSVTAPGTYYSVLLSSTLVDSVVITVLSLRPTYTINRNFSNCGTIPDTVVTVNQFQTVYGCDSTITTTFITHPEYFLTATVLICQGETYVLPNGLPVTSPGTYNTSVLTGYGCDSIVITSLYFSNPVISPIITTGDTLAVTSSGVRYDWYLNGIFLTTDSSGVLPVMQSGHYAVVAFSADSCPSDSAVIDFTLGIGSADVRVPISLYPNPAADVLTLEHPGFVPESICVTDMTGRTIRCTAGIGSVRTILPVDELPAGCYGLLIKGERGETLRMKFLVR
jgi:hypothetical protein